MENGITFPSMALDLALDTGKGLEPQGNPGITGGKCPEKYDFGG